MDNADNISIRPLTPDDLEDFKALRLRALEEHPNYFSTSRKEAEARPDEYWNETLDGKEKQVFGLFDNQKLIGITAIFKRREDPGGESAVFAMSYILPDYRGHGLAQKFFTARIDWAITQKQFKKLIVCHREGNEPSRRNIIKHGFTLIKTEETDWPDGARDLEYTYELDLEQYRD